MSALPVDTRDRLAEIRESLYLLSIELVILYAVAFGLLALKTDNMFSVGMAYTAVLFTSLLAYLMPTLALLFSVVGFERGYNAALAAARGAAVFMTVAFLLVALLAVSLWSTPLVCVYVNDTSTQCYSDTDPTWQDTDPGDARFVFPSQAQYLEYMDLANTTVADLFLKTTLSENDYVTKLHAVLAVPLVFVILVLQNSFFYAIYGVAAHDEPQQHAKRTAFTVADLFRLFVRCALLLLCVVVDSTDLFAAWNIVDVGPQMLPSLMFTSALIFADFSDTLLENALETWTPPQKRKNLKYKLRLSVCVCAMSAVFVYAMCACVVASHYALGGFTQLRPFITDTRLTTIHMMFVLFLLLDAWSAFAHSLFKIHDCIKTKHTEHDTNAKKGDSRQAHAEEAPFDIVTDNLDRLDLKAAGKLKAV